MDLAYKLKRLWAFCFMARPRIYESVEEMDKAIEDYFNPLCTVSMETDCGTIEFEPKRERIKKPTISGLTLALGFSDKTTLYDYRDRPEFSHSIKTALLRIEQYHEEGLSENNVAGRIFALKNMGWKDKIEQDLNHNGGVQIVMNKVESVKPSYETKAE